MKEVQCYDGDGVKPGDSRTLSDGVILKSARIAVSERLARLKVKKCTKEDWIALSMSHGDFRLCNGFKEEQNIYLPRRNGNRNSVPLVLQGVTADSYQFVQNRHRRTVIIKCKKIAQWWFNNEMTPVDPEKWFTDDEIDVMRA